MLALGSAADYGDILGILREDKGYATPKVDVRAPPSPMAACSWCGKSATANGRCPRGWADVNQTAGECVVREIREESGFEARILKLAAVHDYQRSNRPVRHIDSILQTVFRMRNHGRRRPRASDETSEVAFFPRNALPPLSLGANYGPRRSTECFSTQNVRACPPTSNSR